MHTEAPQRDLPGACHWMDVTLYLDFEGSRSLDVFPWEGFNARLYTRMHPQWVTAGLKLQVTSAWRECVDGSGLLVCPSSSTPTPMATLCRPLLRPFMARAVEEVHRWLVKQDEAGLVGLWLHVWTPRIIGRMLSGGPPWQFNACARHLVQVSPAFDSRSESMPASMSEPELGSTPAPASKRCPRLDRSRRRNHAKPRPAERNTA
jgi:hypothetical protein